MSSVSRAWSIRSARRCSKGWPAAARSSGRRSAARRSSYRRRPKSSSIPSTSSRSRRPCARPLSCRARTWQRAPPTSCMTSTSRRAGGGRFWSPLETRKPDLDQRPDRVLEPGLAGDGESLLVALAYLGRIDPLLETIVAGDEQLLDPLVRVSGLHERSLAAHISV